MAQAKDIVVNALLFVGGVGIGYGAAYFIQKRRYDVLFEKEIAQVKAIYSDPSRKTGIFESPIEAAKALITATDDSEINVNPALLADNSTAVAGRSRVQDILREENYLRGAEEYDGVDRNGEPEPESEGTAYNLIEQAVAKSEEAPAVLDPNKPIEEYAEDLRKVLGEDAPDEPTSIWNPDTMAQNEADAAESMPEPDPEHPYVITYEQFADDSLHKENKVNVIYYEGDEQLSDENGHLVDDIDTIVGIANLDKFGLGSNDKNYVYIRNEKMEIDIEVVRDKRSFSKVVLGFDEPVQRARPLRMREDDH